MKRVLVFLVYVLNLAVMLMPVPMNTVKIRLDVSAIHVSE